MLNLITSVLQLDLYINEAETSYDKAQRILDAIEEAEMVPPLDASESFYIKENGELVYNNHKWEKE